MFRALVITVLLVMLLAAGALAAQEEGDIPLDAGKREAIVRKVVSELNGFYIYPEVASKIEERLLGRLGSGDYDRFGELPPFLKVLREDMFELSGDRHLGVWPIWMAPVPADTSEAARKAHIERMRSENFGFAAVDRLPGNIGYVDIRYFARPQYGREAAETVMGSLAGADAVIVDLRGNHGGSEHMVNLICAYFFDEPVHTISIYTRYRGETVELWTPSEIKGPRMAGTPLYVLQSGATASGGEHFSYSMKAAGRATVIGERSRGAANPVEERLYPGLSINIALPVSRAFSPVTGTDWEGTGVLPDIEVPAGEALDRAHLLALRELFDKAEDGKRRRELEVIIQGLER